MSGFLGFLGKGEKKKGREGKNEREAIFFYQNKKKSCVSDF